MEIEDQKKFYNNYWSNKKAISYSKRARVVSIISKLGDYCEPGSSLKILDLGCGDARSVSVWSLFGIPYGLELSPDAVREANKCFPEFKIIEGNATQTPFENNFFDVIINQEVIEHIENQEQLLKECYRILKNEGHLILTTPNKYYFDRRRGGNYSKQPIEKIIDHSRLKKMLINHQFAIIDMESIIPKKGHFGIYYFMDRILARLGPGRFIIDYLKNRFLLSAHLLVVASKKL